MSRSTLADYLRPGDHVVVGQVTGEPEGLVRELIELAPRLGHIDAFCGFSLNPAWDADFDAALRVSTYCGLGTVARAVAHGRARVIPCQLSQLSAWFACGKLRADVVLLQVSPADAAGFHSLGFTADYVWDAVQVARVVLVQVNPNIPHTRSSIRLHASRVVVLRQEDAPLAELPAAAPGELQLRIGRHVAQLVPDGATIQLGIGSLAAAVAQALTHHRGLRVRSGMVGDWLPGLVACGAVYTGEAGACMASLAVGSRALYASIARDAYLEFAQPAALVAADERAAPAPFMAINSAIEVDVHGQANAEFIGERYAGAVGGQPDYFRAARRSAGGLTFVALPATTGRAGKSRVVERIDCGCVTSAQSDVDIIVTEHGAADIRATSLGERRGLIAAIADPRFRAGLAGVGEREATS